MGGKWHKFNQNYISYLRDQVDDGVDLIIAEGENFSEREFQEWKLALPENERKGMYPEKRFNSLRENEGYQNFDRHMATIQSTYKIEKMDLLHEDTLFFVKIGTPQKLSYVIDQSLMTVKVLQNKATNIEVEGRVIKPEKICLWLILERRTNIAKISEINSLIFLMKLAEWKKQCVNARYQPMIKISYRV